MAARLFARTVFNARSLRLVGKAYVSRPTMVYRTMLPSLSSTLPQARAFSLTFPRFGSGEGT